MVFPVLVLLDILVLSAKVMSMNVLRIPAEMVVVVQIVSTAFCALV
jgi:hypothetical protein